MTAIPSSLSATDEAALDAEVAAIGMAGLLAEFENYDPNAEHVTNAGDMLCYLLEHGEFPILNDPDLANDASMVQAAEDLRSLNMADPDLADLVAALTAFLNDSGNPVSTSSDNQNFIDEWNALHPDQATTGSPNDGSSPDENSNTTVTADDMIAYFFKTGSIASAIGIFLTGMDETDADGNVTHKDGFQAVVNDSLENLLDQYDEQMAQLQDLSDEISGLDITDEETQLRMKTIDIETANIKSQVELTNSTMKTIQDCLNSLIQFKSDETQREGSLSSQIISNMRG